MFCNEHKDLPQFILDAVSTKQVYFYVSATQLLLTSKMSKLVFLRKAGMYKNLLHLSLVLKISC